MESTEKIKIALVHDFLIYPGGAEKVLKALSEIYPEAPIYTLLYDEKKMADDFAGKDIRPSYLQNFPGFLRKHHRWLLPFYPTAVETFDFRDFDLVISSSGAWSKGIVTKLNTKHVAYLHSPMRFVWDYNEKYLQEKGRKTGIFVRFFLNYLRVWDRLAAERPEYLLANSVYTQKRISKYYKRDSQVIYPPVEKVLEVRNLELEKQIQPTTYSLQPSSYFLIVSRLSPYKKIDVAVEAFNKLGLPLVVIGQGQQEKYLKKIAKENVQILGWQNAEVVEKYFENACGFVFPGEDDFGIAPVEAMAHGVPVLAYSKGGACEIVQEGITGEFFAAQTPEVLADGVRRFMLSKDKYEKEVIIKRAQEFSTERFKREFRGYINKIL
jgi:glycosyltransferase involved in cell wall biosynthesis